MCGRTYIVIFSEVGVGNTLYRQPDSLIFVLELSTVCRHLNIKATDGKKREIVVADIYVNCNFFFSMVTLKCISAFNALNTFMTVSIVALLVLLSSFEIWAL